MKVGIIGCGLIGKKRAESFYRQHEIVCVSDTNIDRANEFIKFNKDLAIFSDWNSVVSDKTIDIVVVATPNNLLTPIGLEAIKNKKHVLLEKPAGISLSELEALDLAAKNSGLMVKVGFNHRFHPSLRKAKELIDSGALGELMFIRGRYGHGGRIGYEKEWRANPKISGGGELIDQGVHLIDLSRWFLGEFKSVEGSAHTMYWDMPVDDNCFMKLKTEKSQVAWLHVSCSEWKNLFSFEIYGKNAKIQIDGLGGSYGIEKITFYKMLQEMGPPETTSWEFPAKDLSWELEFKNFVNAILNKEILIGDSNDALEAMKIVDKIYKDSGYDYN